MTVELTLADINGRFQVLNRPMANPGKCCVCGAVNKPVVDFGLSLDWYGAVYICVEDMKAAARILNMVDRELLTQAELVRRPDAEKVRETTSEFVERVSDLVYEYADRFSHVCSLPAEVQSEILDRESKTIQRSNEENSRTNDSTPRDERPAGLPGSSSNEFRIFDV